MNEATDVSLESDRLEQLLEIPPPGQPVVMIEYRNRGFPWWMLGSVLVLVPAAVAVIFLYYNSVVEKYRAEASKAAYLLQTRAIENSTPGDQPAADVVTLGPAAANTAELSMQVVGSAAPEPGGTAEAVAKAPADSTTRVETASQDAEAPSESFTTSLDGQPRERVRSIFPSPFTSEKQPVDSNVAGENHAGGAAGTDDQARPAEFSVGKLASGEKTGREGDRSDPGEGGGSAPAEAVSPAAKPADAAVTKGAADKDPQESVTPPLEPLPTREEFANQLAQEAARKEREMAEEQAGQAERLRAQRSEDRLSFHKELRELLATFGKQSGQEIDNLVKRSRGDHDPRTYARARSIWRFGRMSQQAKATQIRALGVPEADILNFLSDNLYARMRTPGGPRDSNEVRMRAAHLLLTYELPAQDESPARTTAPSPAPESREQRPTRPE